MSPSSERAHRRRISGHCAVIERRLGELREAILARDWVAVETEHDRVRRAVEKLRRQEGADALGG